MHQSCPRLLDGEHPADGYPSGVALPDAGLDLPGECLFVADAAVQALLDDGADFDLGHIQSDQVLGREVEFQLAQDTPGLLWLKGAVQRRRLVCAEVVHDDSDHFSIWVVLQR